MSAPVWALIDQDDAIHAADGGVYFEAWTYAEDERVWFFLPEEESRLLLHGIEHEGEVEVAIPRWSLRPEFKPCQA